MKSVIFFLLVSLHSYAQEIIYHNIDVSIDAGLKKIMVEGRVDVDFQNNDTIEFVIWKNTLIKEISCSGILLEYNFDTLSSSPIMYIPKGRMLTILKKAGISDKQSILFKYDCDMRELKGWANSFSEDWIELNFYCAWYPVNLNSRNFTSILKIHIDDDYSVTGSGIVSKKKDYWEMIQPWSGFDNVIIASKKLKSKILKENDALIQTDYNAIDFPEADADSVIAQCKYVLNLFERSFGKMDSTYLKFVIAPFQQGGYSRKNFVCMRSKQFDLNTAKGIAHEIAHFWWNNAVTTTWEDWLNEAFAEYSMLLYIRERMGIEEFQKLLDEYKNRTQNLPPVWGIDRNAQEAYSVLYEKGSIILYEIEKMVGKTAFLNFLKEVSNNKVSKTEDMLNLMEKILSKEIRLELENKLKAS